MDVCKAFVIYMLQPYGLKLSDLSERDQDILISMVKCNTTMDINRFIVDYIQCHYKVV